MHRALALLLEKQLQIGGRGGPPGDIYNDGIVSLLLRLPSSLSTAGGAGLTGGEVVLNSSDAAELECEGVSGGMPMNW